MKKPEPAPAEANPFRRAVFMVPILRTWLPLPLGTEKNPTMTLKFKKNCLDIGVHYNFKQYAGNSGSTAITVNPEEWLEIEPKFRPVEITTLTRFLFNCSTVQAEQL